jgi:TrmH family RNA methyltransferase
MNETPRAGQVKEITSLANPVIKDIRGLALKKNRDAQKQFVAEGMKLVTDALEGNWPVHVLVYAKRMAHEPHLQAVAAKARARGALILEVSEKVLGTISRRDNPQMVIAVFGQRWSELSSIKPRNNDVWVALDRVRDPGNLGTIVRTVDAVGAKGVILVGETTDPWGIEAVRATMGSLFHVPLARATTGQFLDWRKSWQGMVVGTHLEGAVDYREPDYSASPVLLLMGNEQQGLPPELAAACDALCLIPMAGAADSLNLAVATGVMLFEVRRAALKVGLR